MEHHSNDARQLQKLEHVIRAQQFDRPLLECVFREARMMEEFPGPSKILANKIIQTLFYEPSTRTRLSFESAAYRAGARILTTDFAGQFSSAAKGESLEDTIRVISGYGIDAIVMRHNEMGAAERAAKVSSVPIINAGDGAGQHPTQMLLDLYTILKELGRIDNLTIAMVGDLANSRTVRSLAYMLAKFDQVKICFVAPDVTRVHKDIREYLEKHKLEFYEEKNLEQVAGEVDVIYQTRIQKERFADLAEYEEACGVYIIDQHIMDKMKPKAIVMHPLPRVDEIAKEVDKDPRAAYFRQAHNGLPVRMALLKMVILGYDAQAPSWFARS